MTIVAIACFDVNYIRLPNTMKLNATFVRQSKYRNTRGFKIKRFRSTIDTEIFLKLSSGCVWPFQQTFDIYTHSAAN